MNVYLLNYFPKLDRNGVDTYVSELGSYLEQIDSISMHYVWIDCNNESVEIKTTLTAVHIYLPKFNPLISKDKRNPDEYLASHIVKDAQNKENIIIHINWMNHCGVSRYLKSNIDCRIILTNHCLPWKDLMFSNYNQFFQLLEYSSKDNKLDYVPRILEKDKYFYDNVDKIITVTRSAETILQNIYQICKTKLKTIYNGTSISRREVSTEMCTNLRLKYGFNSADVLLLYAGRITKLKGIIDFIKVFEEFITETGATNIKLLIAGNGQYDKVLEEISTLHGNIVLLGGLSKTKLYEFYHFVNIGLIPSYTEQCSFTALEMLHCSLPILASDLDGLRELVTDQKGLRFKVVFSEKEVFFDDNDIKIKLKALIDNSSYACRGYHCRTNDNSEYTSSFMANKTIELYKDVFAQLPFCNLDQNDYQSDKIFTVIIIIDDSSDLLFMEDCLASIKRQKYSRFEIVVLVLTEELKLDRLPLDVKAIRYQKKEEEFSCFFNYNMSLLMGDFVTFIYGRDIMDIDRLSSHLNFFCENLEYGMVTSWYNIIDDDGLKTGQKHQTLIGDFLELELYFKCPYYTSTVSVRTELMKNLLLRDLYPNFEFHDLWMRIAEQSKIGIIPKKLCTVRRKDIEFNTFSKEQKHTFSELICDKIDGTGVEFSEKELFLHYSLCFNNTSIYRKKENIHSVDTWLNKFFGSEYFSRKYGHDLIEDFLKYFYLNN